MLLKLQVPKPKEYIDTIIGKEEGIHLVNYFVSKNTFSVIEGEV